MTKMVKKWSTDQRFIRRRNTTYKINTLITLTNVHNQVPDKHKSSSNSAIYIPKPETEKYGVPCFISELGSKVEKVIPVKKNLKTFENTYVLRT